MIARFGPSTFHNVLRVPNRHVTSYVTTNHQVRTRYVAYPTAFGNPHLPMLLEIQTHLVLLRVLKPIGTTIPIRLSFKLLSTIAIGPRVQPASERPERSTQLTSVLAYAHPFCQQYQRIRGRQHCTSDDNDTIGPEEPHGEQHQR